MDTIRTTLRLMGDAMRALHRDERGAEGIEKLLILAAVALPLLGILIFARESVSDWVSTIWDREYERGSGEITDPFPSTGTQ